MGEKSVVNWQCGNSSHLERAGMYDMKQLSPSEILLDEIGPRIITDPISIRMSTSACLSVSASIEPGGHLHVLEEHAECTLPSLFRLLVRLLDAKCQGISIGKTPCPKYMLLSSTVPLASSCSQIQKSNSARPLCFPRTTRCSSPSSRRLVKLERLTFGRCANGMVDAALLAGIRCQGRLSYG